MNKIIPLRPEAPQGGDCASAESFALMVLGDSMEPEFHQGEIIIIEPEGLAKDGSYVLAWHDEEFIFRQLKKHEDGWWRSTRPIPPLIWAMISLPCAV